MLVEIDNKFCGEKIWDGQPTELFESACILIRDEDGQVIREVCGIISGIIK